MPNKIASTQASISGDIVYRKAVKHPGTDARNFPDVIGKKWQREWPRQLSRALASVDL